MLAGEDQEENLNLMQADMQQTDDAKAIAKKILLEEELLPEEDASDTEWLSEVSQDHEEEDEEEEEFDEEMVIEEPFGTVSAQMLDLDAPEDGKFYHPCSL